MSFDISVKADISNYSAKILLLSHFGFKCLLFSVLLFSFQQACAQPFLWQVTGKHSFYLFGTIHLPDPRLVSIPDDVIEKVKESTAFYGELDLHKDNLLRIRQSMWLPHNETIYDWVPADIQLEVKEYLATINPEINLDFFSNQKVWVLAVTLTLLEQQLRYPQLYPMDVLLFNEAVSLGKNVGGLETIEDQTRVFDALSADQQIQMLQDTLEFLVEQDDEFIGETVQDYIEGDLDSLMDNLMAYMKEDDFYDALIFQLLTQRNINMTESIMNLVSQNPKERYFFAVGVGHFWGSGSIIELLKEQGYSVELME